MRQQRTQQMSTPAQAPKTRSDVAATGYVLIVDGQAKTEFKTREQALEAARDLKGRVPMLQIKVYDAEKKVSELVGS